MGDPMRDRVISTIVHFTLILISKKIQKSNDCLKLDKSSMEISNFDIYPKMTPWFWRIQWNKQTNNFHH
jgi:hypothetical protein